jgi:hypothetical protein
LQQFTKLDSEKRGISLLALANAEMVNDQFRANGANWPRNTSFVGQPSRGLLGWTLVGWAVSLKLGTDK